MSRRRWLFLIGSLALLAAFAFDRVFRILWVSVTEQTVEFTVADAATGQPIPDATISIENSLPRDGEEEHFTLTTSADGSARRLHRSLCSGEASGLGFTNTWGTMPPHWSFRVEAAGYEPTDFVYIGFAAKGKRVERTGPDTSRFEVFIALKKME